MNENYKWKGITFTSKGVVIEKIPLVSRANHSYTKYTIPGRSGNLVIDNKTYDEVPFSLECHFNNTTTNINDVKSWLDGYGKLQLDNEKEYTGYVSNVISFEQIKRFDKFIVQFMLKPFAKALTPTTITRTTSGTFTANTVNTYPTITITGSGTIGLTLNGTSFTISNANGTYILDCEAKIITKAGLSQSSSMSGDFPMIINGSNSLTVSGTISALEISYYKTYL